MGLKRAGDFGRETIKVLQRRDCVHHSAARVGENTVLLTPVRGVHPLLNQTATLKRLQSLARGSTCDRQVVGQARRRVAVSVRVREKEQRLKLHQFELVPRRDRSQVRTK